MWRPGVDTRCQMQCLLHLIFETGSHWIWCLLIGKIYLLPSSSNWVPASPALVLQAIATRFSVLLSWNLRFRLRSFCLCGKHITNLAISPALMWIFYSSIRKVNTALLKTHRNVFYLFYVFEIFQNKIYPGVKKYPVFRRICYDVSLPFAICLFSVDIYLPLSFRYFYAQEIKMIVQFYRDNILSSVLFGLWPK